MVRERARSLLGNSQLARSLGRRENRWALAITAAVGLAVALASRLPFDPDLSLDLRARESRVPLVTYLGFGRAGARGRALRETEARVVLGRRLPERFTLEIVAATTDGAERDLAVRVGGSRHVVALDGTPRRHRLDVESREGTREISLRAGGADPRVVVSAIRLERAAP